MAKKKRNTRRGRDTPIKLGAAGGITGPKFSDTEREELKAGVAQLDRQGYRQMQIAVKLGISQTQVSFWLKEIRLSYKECQLASRNEVVAEKLDQYRYIRQEATEAWERSQQSDDENRRRAGDAIFLRIMIDVTKAEREMLGLDEAIKIDQRTVTTTIDWDEFAKQEVPDRIGERLAAKQIEQVPSNGKESSNGNGKPE